MSLISDVTSDRTVVAPGESLRIDVSVVGGRDDVDVSIDGIRGTSQFLQAPLTPGQHTVDVLAGADGAAVERHTVTFTVEDRPALPLLALQRDPYRPMAAMLHVADTDAAAFPPGSVFRWLLGDAEVVTAEPVLVHDFSGLVDDTQPFTTIDVALHVAAPDGTTTTVSRSLTAWSAYQITRAAGVVQPPTTSTGLTVPGREGRHTASLTARNVEDQAVTFTSRRVEWFAPDVDTGATFAPVETVDLTLPAHGVLTVPLDVDRSSAPRRCDGFTVHLLGTLADGTPAHLSESFEFGRRPLRFRLPDLELYTEPILDRIPDLLRPAHPERRPEWLDRVSVSVGSVLDERQWWGIDTAARRVAPAVLAGAVHAPAVVDLRADVVSKLMRSATEELVPSSSMPSGLRSGTLRERLGERVRGHSGVSLLEGVEPLTPGRGGVRVGRRGRGGGDGPDPGRRRVGLTPGTSVLPERLTRLVLSNVRENIARTALSPLLPTLRDGLHLDDGGLKWGAQVREVDRQWLHSLDVPPTENSPCDPDDLPDDVPDGWACQFTGRSEQRWLPGRIVNAQKGDIVLSPGGNGLIGGLLKQVSPPQRFSHTMIMTKNYYEMAHSTASEDWLQAHPNGSVAGEPAPTDGFEPKALKYLWPGGIVQSAEEGHRGSEFTCPEGQKYTLKAFGLQDSAQYGDRWELIPAMVVKPHPSKETAEVRRQLHRIADQARQWCVTGPETAAGKQSKLHYRFNCYSDAAMATRIDPATGQPEGLAPAEASWPGGTLPTVCSSMVWLAARTVGQHLEGPGDTVSSADLEPQDLARGQAVDGQTPDGLYFYDAAERHTAAEWLYGTLHEKISRAVKDKLGDLSGVASDLVGFFTDIADDCANQMINTFAFDFADEEAKDSTRWKDEDSTGRAVSPDDLMAYDEPGSVTGQWGYAVPLIYRAGRFEDVPVTTWRRTSGPGTLTGLVRAAGVPAVGAMVDVGGTHVFTGGDGRFSVVVQEGRYSVHVTQQAPYGLREKRQDLTVTFRETTDVVIDLDDPPEVYRELLVEGFADGNDDEDFDDDENMHQRVHLGPYQLGPYDTHEEFGWGTSWGGEVRVAFSFKADWQHDNALALHVDGTLYEGTSENTDDFGGSTSGDWWIPAGETQVHELYVRNDEDDENTWCRLVLNVTNHRAP